MCRALLRDYPLGQIVVRMEILSVVDGEIPAPPKAAQDTAGQRKAPVVAAGFVLEVGRAQRTFVANTLQDCVRFPPVLLEHAPPPRVLLFVLAAAKLENWVELHRNPARFVAPVLEERGFRTEQGLRQGGIEAGEPG